MRDNSCWFWFFFALTLALYLTYQI